MFDWFWDFLYLITKSIFRLIDGLIDSSLYIGGINTVKIDGDDTDLLTWIFERPEIKTGFSIACLVGIILIVFFSIWQIVKVMTSEKVQGTPAQVAIKAFKNVMIFLLVPAIMVILVAAMNAVGRVMFDGTLAGTNVTLGKYLALSFGRDACTNSDIFNELVSGSRPIDYTRTSDMWTYFELSDYDYFFSWVAGIAILFTLAKALFIFVDRLFSIVILYVISPFAIASSIVDDGQRFKSWRDQILIKFLTGYATLVGINIFSIIVSNICTADITFFPDSSFLDFLLKIVIVVGGTLSLNRIIALVGNIIQNGAGEAELRNAEGMSAGFKGVTGKAFGLATAGFKGLKSLGGLIKDKVSGSKGDSNKSGSEGSSSSSSSKDNESSNKSPTAGNNQQSKATNNSKPGNAVVKAITGSGDDKKNESNKNNDSNKMTNKPDYKNNAVNKVMNQNSVLSQAKDKGGNKK